MPENFGEILIWSAVLAFVAAIVACVIVIVRYKRKLKSPIYPIEKYADLSLNVSRDDFIGSTVTCVRVSSSKNKR